MCFSVLVIRLALSFLSCSLENVSGNIAAVRCHVDLPVPVVTHKRMGFYCSEILIIDDLGALVTLFLCVSVAEMDGLRRQYVCVAVGLLPLQQMTALHIGAHAVKARKQYYSFMKQKINKTQRSLFSCLASKELAVTAE